MTSDWNIINHNKYIPLKNQLSKIQVPINISNYFYIWKKKSSINTYEQEFKHITEIKENSYISENKDNIRILINSIKLVVTQYITMTYSIFNIIITNILDNKLFYDYIDNLIDRLINIKKFFIKIDQEFELTQILFPSLPTNITNPDAERIIKKIEGIYKKKMLMHVRENNKFEKD